MFLLPVGMTLSVPAVTAFDGDSRRDGERDRSGRLRPARGGAALADKPGLCRHHASGNGKGVADRDRRRGTGTSG